MFFRPFRNSHNRLRNVLTIYYANRPWRRISGRCHPYANILSMEILEITYYNSWKYLYV
jgi:hypothetical protein